MNSWSHILVFVVTAFSAVAWVLLHAHPSLRKAQGGIFLLDVVSEKHSILARSVFVLHGHRLCRDIAVVLIASIAIWIPDTFLFFYRETGNWRFTGSEMRNIPYHWSRSNGLVSFTMSSGGQDGYSFIPRWNEDAASLESFDQRVKLFVSSTKKEERYLYGPRLLATFDPEEDTFRYVRDNLTDVQLEAADGSGALMIVRTIRLSVGPKSIQEGVRLLLDFFRLDSLRRNYGETMRHWTRRSTLQYSKVGQALNA